MESSVPFQTLIKFVHADGTSIDKIGVLDSPLEKRLQSHFKSS